MNAAQAVVNYLPVLHSCLNEIKELTIVLALWGDVGDQLTHGHMMLNRGQG